MIIETKSSKIIDYDDVIVANYAIQLIKNLFTQDEIKNGIFGDKNNNTRSKSQTPFSVEKTEQFKSKF